MENFYQTLGVNENATQDEIKKAYRKLAVEHHPDKGGDENKFNRLERIGDGQRDAVGIDAIRFAVAIETKRRDDGDDTLGEQRLQQLHIHALDLAGEQMIHTLNDPHGMRDDGVCAGCAKVVGGQTFENFVRQPVRRRERKLERGRVRDADAVEV